MVPSTMLWPTVERKRLPYRTIASFLSACSPGPNSSPSSRVARVHRSMEDSHNLLACPSAPAPTMIRRAVGLFPSGRSMVQYEEVTNNGTHSCQCEIHAGSWSCVSAIDRIDTPYGLGDASVLGCMYHRLNLSSNNGWMGLIPL